ncbi:cysteine-rich CWC family protein [Colwellia sp. BRX10-3]|uniref:cysteine-rich CWC family protein n=1 Tax=Colwellia sp. BRX10-3 TaxID=2759844 RepID=UPI0015F4E6D4|nr:cysteine-rich CWC family protein [Colwellia sp. BRX10-3]MBA6392430.1 cysteine-rich CWC family protein [Colwellia sp. BRX10-3]
MSTIDKSQCPLCQQKNLCEVDASTPCWCVSIEVKRELLAQVPKALTSKSCICKSCIDKFNFDKIVDRS